MEKKDNLVSIIVPVYMASEFLDRCLESIINQSYKNIEIVLIDDYSLDDSYLICEKYSQQDNRIIIHKNKCNLGVSSSRNIGISLAKGKYIIFIDSDDYIDENYIESLIKEQYVTKADLIITSRCNVKGNEKKYIELNKKTFDPTLERRELISLIYKNVLGYVTNKMFLSEIIKEKNILFNEEKKIFEDQKFTIEYIKACKSISIIPNIYYYYVNNCDSVMNNLPPSYLNLCEENFNELKSLFPDDYSEIFVYKKIYAVSCAEMFFYNVIRRNSKNDFKHLMLTYKKHEYMMECREKNRLIKNIYKYNIFSIAYYAYILVSYVRKKREKK
ncbi:glycosyltransferase family 2 protein [uncultured Holdemania sp.]|uniref:glycosyltransferase family 2 protein n=1 Tax=uncultured Holdemania sp. TaxID=527664 RepID=UPI002805E018|nr:glycosyltransferase family 2 protein [uncultured Holdemania sp.]